MKGFFEAYSLPLNRRNPRRRSPVRKMVAVEIFDPDRSCAAPKGEECFQERITSSPGLWFLTAGTNERFILTEEQSHFEANPQKKEERTYQMNGEGTLDPFFRKTSFPASSDFLRYFLLLDQATAT